MKEQKCTECPKKVTPFLCFIYQGLTWPPSSSGLNPVDIILFWVPFSSKQIYHKK